MSLLRVESLSMRFGGLTAVNQVSFTVEPGQIHAIIGPNGAGKTSLFNAITGVYQPTEGAVLLNGHSPLPPFAVRTAAGIGVVTLLTALGVVLAVNVESLWEAVITANYIYQEPFPVRDAIVSFVQYFRDTELRYSVGAALVGAVLGGTGAYTVWRRTRWVADVLSRAGLARTFQNPRLFHQMSVLDNVLVGMEGRLGAHVWHGLLKLPQHRNESREAREKALAILKFVELEHLVDTTAFCLPYGYQRRLEIARALASEPKLLLLDEPAAGMNPREASDLMILIQKIRARGISVLLIEHHMRVVMGISDRITVLEYGNKIAEGTPEEVRANPKVRAAYLGGADL